MGLTRTAGGKGAIDRGLSIRKCHPDDIVVALAGNPNVGKSTVFNGLTGLHQHTGNWPGKTVANAQGSCSTERHRYIFVDIPGTYSLSAHSAEEEVARDFLCFDNPDAIIVVCDATCLERNLNLVLQTRELSSRVILCLNLTDEAHRKGITIDTDRLSSLLGIPVVCTVARKKRSLQQLLTALDNMVETPSSPPMTIPYSVEIESDVARIQPLLSHLPHSRWIALRLLEHDTALADRLQLSNDPKIQAVLLNQLVPPPDVVKDAVVSTLLQKAEHIARRTVRRRKTTYDSVDRRIDRLLTSRILGYPLMLALLALVFWLTITGANYPSNWLSQGLFWVEDRLSDLFRALGSPDWLHDAVVLGAYRVLAWVVSVMLPPMAIFFPLFTLLEDVGYLPRIAYNLDRPFRRCHACGKQALTMCMGFGCNAAGVVGCRIIDSPRERLLAILTNNFVPCNGRFPTLIALLTIFFISTDATPQNSALSAALLTLVILIGILTTFAVTKLLSKTVLKGIPSSFTLELPPYRRPQIGSVLVRSVLDRTLFVLGRAAAVAAPAGLVLWILANITVGDTSLLQHCAAFLDPFAQWMGLDGTILLAFILAFPANEIVLPIALMIYLSSGTLSEAENLNQMRDILMANGWTWTTAVSTMLFSLMHWPCSTTLLTIRKETGSVKWTLLAAALPTALGIAVCMLFTAVTKLFL